MVEFSKVRTHWATLIKWTRRCLLSEYLSFQRSNMFTDTNWVQLFQVLRHAPEKEDQMWAGSGPDGAAGSSSVLKVRRLITAWLSCGSVVVKHQHSDARLWLRGWKIYTTAPQIQADSAERLCWCCSALCGCVEMWTRLLCRRPADEWRLKESERLNAAGGSADAERSRDFQGYEHIFCFITASAAAAETAELDLKPQTFYESTKSLSISRSVEELKVSVFAWRHGLESEEPTELSSAQEPHMAAFNWAQCRCCCSGWACN